MRKRILHILNWDKYQARSDKELPWLKLWGRLFKTPWFQIMPDEDKFVTIALLDLARQFNNNIAEELVFKGYLKGNYGIFISQERIFKLCKYLVDNDFLSDNCPTNVEVEGDIDKIRQDEDKTRVVENLHIDFINSIKANPAYKHISVDTELAKMDAWLSVHVGRKKTKRFVLNWLNKIEAPLPSEDVPESLRRFIK